jgi:hypothetical protein
MLAAMLAIRDDAATWGGHLNVGLVHVPLMPPFVGGFDDHMAVKYLCAEFLEALRELVYARLHSRRRLDVSPSNLKR